MRLSGHAPGARHRGIHLPLLGHRERAPCLGGDAARRALVGDAGDVLWMRRAHYRLAMVPRQGALGAASESGARLGTRSDAEHRSGAGGPRFPGDPRRSRARQTLRLVPSASHRFIRRRQHDRHRFPDCLPHVPREHVHGRHDRDRRRPARDRQWSLLHLYATLCTPVRSS